MNIFVKNEYRVEVELSAEELVSYGITYEEIDYRNIETRKLLWSLTEEIRISCGINIKLSGRLLIEVLREKESSVRICFSSLSASLDDASVRQLIKTENTPVIAQFSDFEEMLQAAAELDKDLESRLYESNGKYRLVLCADEEMREAVSFCICEFGEILENSTAEAARSEEMWSLILAPNAVKILTEVF